MFEFLEKLFTLSIVKSDKKFYLPYNHKSEPLQSQSKPTSQQNASLKPPAFSPGNEEKLCGQLLNASTWVCT